MKTLMKHFLAVLNEQGARFKGNHLFLFEDNADRFIIYENDGSTLVNEEIKYIPVMQTRAEPIIYMTKNKRIDWDVEYYIALRIQGDEYDADNDPDYIRIEQACESLNRTFDEEVIEFEGKRYVFKASPPKRIGYFERGMETYVMVSCSMVGTEIIAGYFGQEVSITLNGMSMDIVRYTRNMTRRYYTGDEKDAMNNDFNTPIGRAMSFSIDVVITNEQMKVLRIARGKSSLKNYHKLVETFNGITTEYDVMVRSTETLAQLNHGRRVVLHFVETRMPGVKHLIDEMHGYTLSELFVDKARSSEFSKEWQPNEIDVSVSWMIIDNALRVNVDATQAWHVKMDVEYNEDDEVYCYAVLKGEDTMMFEPLGASAVDASETRWHIASHLGVVGIGDFKLQGTLNKTMDIRVMGYINLTGEGITLNKTQLDEALGEFALILLHDRGLVL